MKSCGSNQKNLIFGYDAQENVKVSQGAHQNTFQTEFVVNCKALFQLIRNIVRYLRPKCSFKGPEHKDFEYRNSFWHLPGQMQVGVEQSGLGFMKASSLREVKLSGAH